MGNNNFSKIVSFLILTFSSGILFFGFLESSYNYFLLLLAILFFGFGLYILLNENEDKIEKIKKRKN